MVLHSFLLTQLLTFGWFNILNSQMGLLSRNIYVPYSDISWALSCSSRIL